MEPGQTYTQLPFARCELCGEDKEDTHWVDPDTKLLAVCNNCRKSKLNLTQRKSMFEIDSSIPCPPDGRSRPRKYPFPNMGVGESFEVGQSVRDRANVNGALQYYRTTAEGKDKVFTVRHMGNNVYRCWRKK